MAHFLMRARMHKGMYLGLGGTVLNGQRTV